MTVTGYGIAPPHARLPAETHVGRVKLQISDLERSLAFYRSVLGLGGGVLHRDDRSTVLGSDAPIVELVERHGARPVPRRGLLGLYHFAIRLPERASLGRFLAHLDGLGVHAGMSDHLVSEAVYLQDPDNLGIEVYADRPRSEWRVEDGQLSMSTIPLDVRSVMAAGEGKPWTGAPAGTRIGHMHLHVGDIDQAAEFYHDALGLDKTVWSYPGALFLAAGGYHHHLGVNTWARGAPPASDADARLLEWELVVPEQSDVDAAAERMTTAGFAVGHDATDAVAQDPWGTRLRITTAARPK